ncbi:MAG: hypothetical protein AAFY29_06595 [Pseudomonadota bacterium]
MSVQHIASRLILASIVGLLLVPRASSHDMALTLSWAADGMLEGQLRYSDANVAEGNYVRIAVSGAPDLSVLALQTDAGGRFRAPLRTGFAYEVTASGDEGHQVTALIAALDSPISDPAGSSGAPIYLVIAVLLLLSLPLAKALRRSEDPSRVSHGQ